MTEERIIKNEVEIKNLKEQRSQDIIEHRAIFTGISEIKIELAKLPERINDKNADKYARKWVEKAMIALSVGALGNVAGIIYLIIQINK